MSKLEELLKKHCPYGVEYKNLDEIVDILDNLRKPVSKDKRTKGSYPYYGANGIQDYVDNYLFDGAFILMGEDGSVINKDNSPVLNWASGKIWVNNHAHVLFNEDINILRFVFYYLQTIDISSIVRGTPPKINQQNLRNIVIPLPPIKVQKEIVRILDEFIEKTTKLQELLHRETILRKKQYEYYRDKLLTFNDDVEWKNLSEIAEIGTGSSNTNEEIENGKYPFFVRSQEVRSKNEYEYDETAIITSGDGVGVGKIFHYIEGKYALHQRAYRIHIIDENVIPKYYFYYMKTTFLSYIEKTSFHSSVTSIRRPMLDNYPVPVPPLEEQKRIVNILDKFDALCNDITKGLPAEIELRKKQYEYYRDKLLTFKEKKK